jgi:hypothetical protein
MLDGIKYAKELAERYIEIYSSPDAYIDNDFHNGRIAGFKKLAEMFEHILKNTNQKS